MYSIQMEHKALKHLQHALNVLAIENHQIKKRKAFGADADADNQQECPVCYDIINPSKLIIPGCLHAICIDCVVKCDACPLCRDKYDHYIECDPLHPI